MGSKLTGGWVYPLEVHGGWESLIIGGVILFAFLLIVAWCVTRAIKRKRGSIEYYVEDGDDAEDEKHGDNAKHKEWINKMRDLDMDKPYFLGFASRNY